MRGEQKYRINKKYFIKARETAKELERVAGIEPARSAWEADRLPLHHTRKMRDTRMQSLMLFVKHPLIKVV